MKFFSSTKGKYKTKKIFFSETDLYNPIIEIKWIFFLLQKLKNLEKIVY